MSITIKSNTDTILELPGLTGTLGPGKAAVVQAMTPDLLRAEDLGLLLVPSGAEPPEGLPPVVFDHRYPHVLPLTAARAYYVRVLRSPGAFHDGTRPRNFIAYYGDGAGMSCAFSDNGLAWDKEKKVTGIAVNGYHVVCALETAARLRILYWNPDVPNQPYAMAGLRTAVCDPSVDPAAFTGDTPCSGDLVTEEASGLEPRPLRAVVPLVQPLPPRSKEDLSPGVRHVFHRLDRRQRQPRSGLLNDAVVWKLFGNGPILSGLIDPQPWEGANGYVSSAHVERLPTGDGGCSTPGAPRKRRDRLRMVLGPRPLAQGEINPVFKTAAGHTSSAATRRAWSGRRRLAAPLPRGQGRDRLPDLRFPSAGTGPRMA